MEITSATADHEEAVRDVVGRSMRASFSLSPEQMETVIRQEFGEEGFAARLDGDRSIVLVAERDDEVIGVVTGSLTDGDDGEIGWLFVAPEARGEGVGTELFETARDELEGRGAERVRALVMSENVEGEQFFEQFGYEQAGNRELEIDEQVFAAHVYDPEAEEVDQELHTPETVDTEDGTVYPGDEELSGKEAPFLVLYSDEDRTEQYGFFCTSCGTVANAADGLERVDCDTCGNESRPDEWDSSYL